MIRKTLKSVLVLTVVLATAGGATKAWFTSSVTASDNEIQTGTLLMAIDSTDSLDAYTATGYVVAQQNADGTKVQYNNFPDWTVAAPGDAYSVYLAVRNKGSLPFNFRAAAVGGWLSGSRFGTSGCPTDAAAADANLVSVASVHRYASGNCESELGCRNVRDWLNSYGTWAERSGTTVATSGPVSGYYDDGLMLDPNQYVLYRVDMGLDDGGTDDCYQGAAYQYDLMGEAKQVGASW